MTTCPCCSTSMLRHIRNQQVYWFCRQCWQEMPSLEPTRASWVGEEFDLEHASQAAFLVNALRKPQLI